MHLVQIGVKCHASSHIILPLWMFQQSVTIPDKDFVKLKAKEAQMSIENLTRVSLKLENLKITEFYKISFHAQLKISSVVL